jgi:oxygen-independent coproporphyrinogen III oxidase
MDMTQRWDPPVFDTELILKYDKPGPRYTSYPTAPYFVQAFDTDSYCEVIESTNAAPDPPPLSLYFHLPFCRSVCYFCGCNVVYTKDRTLGDLYVDSMIQEMDSLVSLMKPGREVVQVHWGGGTPTFLSAPLLRRLWDAITERFAIASGAEIGVEIDPREVTDEHLEMFAECGFNRMSMGIQDFDPQVQEAVHRVQPEELTLHVFNRCRRLGLESINVDLIYGLPFQTRDRFADTVDKIITMAPDRIAAFNFAYLPDMIGHQKAIPRDALPSPSEKLAILKMLVERFTESGYVYVGMDHFARPEDELCVALRERTLYRNFQGYTTKAGCDLYGVGVTSIGQVGPCYAQNAKDLKSYQESIREKGLAVFRGVLLTEDDILRRDVITRLMCHFVLYKEEIESKYGIRFDVLFADALEDLKPLEADGLLELHPERIEVKPLGRLLVRNIAMAFDAYLRKGDQKRFSRTV